MFLSLFWNVSPRPGLNCPKRALWLEFSEEFELASIWEPFKFKENVELMKYGMAVFKNCITAIADSVLPKHRTVSLKPFSWFFEKLKMVQKTYESLFLKQNHVDIIGRILSNYDEQVLILNTLSFAEKLLAVRPVFIVMLALWMLKTAS